ncbi:MAG: TetR family transcriptional regulator [Actinoplanes sp.]
MTAPARPRRDAARTRLLLLDAARRRFVQDGYAATTVRDIADDAGVNVALISRYFVSKEGLFEQCLSAAVDELRSTVEVPLERIGEAIVRHSAGPGADGRPGRLAMLLRKSGDERADAIRLGVLRASSERLATLAGWRPGEPGADALLLRAQLVLATAIGLSLLRAATPVEPLASATDEELLGPLQDLVAATLGPG